MVLLSNFFNDKNKEEIKTFLSENAFFLFDIHQVLFYRKGIMPFIKSLLKAKKKHILLKEAIQALFSKTTWQHVYKKFNQKNKITEAYLDAVLPFHALHNEMLIFSNNIYTLNNKMNFLLIELKKKHSLYLLSNIGSFTFKKLQQNHPDFFSLFNVSYNTINYDKSRLNTVWKPQINAFHKSLDHIGYAHEPHKGIFIDDKIANIKAAHKAGLNAILFKSHAQLQSDLKTMEIL